MKVAQVNTLMHGGAAVVAKRLHQALLESGVDSLLLTKYGRKNDVPKHFFLKDGTLNQFLRKKLSHPALFAIAKYVQGLQLHPNLVGRSKEFEIFSVLNMVPLGKHYAMLNGRDVIHLHWVSNFIDYGSFFKQLADKKFVWSLHDMNPITGGCHHADGCIKFATNCVQCPQLQNTIDLDYASTIQRVKIEGLKYLKDDQMIIVSPSAWLANLSERSRITGRFKHVVIENPSFKPVRFSGTREDIRRKLDLPTNKRIVLFASDNLKNPRKGIPTLFEALHLLQQKDEILLVGIGHKGDTYQDLNIKYTGNLSNTDLLANYFYCCDLFVTPSVAENSPLVVIESLMCGTPVVASAVGGIPELLNETNGLLFPAGNVNDLARTLEYALLEMTFDRQKISADANALYNPQVIAESYKKVYLDLLR